MSDITLNISPVVEEITIDANIGNPGPTGPAGPTYDPADYTDVIYIAQHGSDLNDGFSPEEPLLTMSAAETAAETLTTGSNRVLIHILDSGSYTKSGALTVDDYIHLYGPHATLETRLVLRDEARVTLHKLYVDDSGFPGINKNSGSLNAFVHIDEIDGRGADGTVTNKLVIRNQGGGGVLIVRADRIWVPQGGVGVGDTAGGFGHIHVECEDLYLAGNNAVGLQGNSDSSSVIARIGHILETGTPTGTIGLHAESATSRLDVLTAEILADTAVKVEGAGAEVNLVAGRIASAVAWNVSDGTLYLSASRADGTKTQTGGTVHALVASEGLVAVSPDGTRYRIDVDNSGVLSTTEV